MITYIKCSSTGEDAHTKDKEVYEYLNKLEQIKNRKLTLFDVGGAAKLRIPEYTTHVLDFQPEKLNNDTVYKFGGDMELNDTWEPIFKYVEDNGKFDFVVCTHTLEDLNAPIQVILNLFKIADAGLIAVPTKYIETTRFENWYLSNSNYMGYCHHRWIYTIKNNVFCGFPKMGSMEYQTFNFAGSEEYNKKFNNLQTEMSFIWEDNFDIDFIPPYQYYDNFTHPERKSKLLDLIECDDIDDLFLTKNQ